LNHPHPKPIPVEAYLEIHAAVVGKTGSGKTSTAKTMVEQLAATNHRVCVLDPIKSDWWGMKSNPAGDGPGFPFIILGGPRQDLPLPPDSGAAIAELVGSGKLPLSIIDLSDFTNEQLSAWYIDFAEALFKKNRGAMHLVLEEADVFAPKERAIGDESMRIHWSSKLARAGRSKGIRLIVSSQRTQKLHNDLLGSCDTLIAHRLVFPADQKPINDWLKSAASKETADAIATSLAELQTGEAWVYSPERKILQRQFVKKIGTFDNSRTPAAGDAEGSREVATAAVDVEAIRGALATAIKAAEDQDPEKLRKKVDQLEKALRAAEGMKTAPYQDAERLRFEGRAAARVEMRDYLRPMFEAFQQHLAGLNAYHEEISAILQRLQVRDSQDGPPVLTARAMGDLKKGQLVTFVDGGTLSKPADQFRSHLIRPGRELGAVASPLAGPHQKIVDAIAWWNQVGVGHPTRVQVAVVAGYTASGGTFNRYLSALSSEELITYPDSGTVDLTLKAEPFVRTPAAPPTLAELHRRVMEVLDGPHRKLMAVLLEHRGREVPRTQLAELAGYEASGGTFNRYCSTLSSLGLIKYPKKTTVAAAPILFPEGLR